MSLPTAVSHASCWLPKHQEEEPVLWNGALIKADCVDLRVRMSAPSAPHHGALRSHHYYPHYITLLEINKVVKTT